MKRSLPSLPLLLFLVLPCLAALVGGGESAVTTPRLDVAAFDQTQSRMATDGSAFFAVWKSRHPYSGAEIHGSGVSSEGARLHDAPIVIAGGASMEDAPAIAWGSGRYLVAWSTATATATEMRARFVGADGSLSEVLVLGTSEAVARPRIAFNGRVFLVLWLAPALQLRGAIVTPAGAVTKTFDVATAALTYPEIPLVASGSTFHFVTARIDVNTPAGSNGHSSSVHITPVDENGTVGDAVTLAPAVTPVFHLRADARGGEIVVAWATAVGIPGGAISSVHLTASGPSSVDSFEASTMQLYDVVAEATGSLLIYGNDNTRLARYAGTTADVTLPRPAGISAIDDAASNGMRTLLLTRGLARFGDTHGPAGNDLYVQRLDTPQLEPLAIAPRHQALPDIAAAGDLRLAAWSEYAGSERRVTIMAARLNALGQTLDPDGIDLGIDTDFAISARVASNGTDWLIVWRKDKTVFGTRIARNGTRLDTTPLTIATDVYDATDVALSWDGTQYIVIYTRGVFIRGLQTRVIAARVPANGSVQAPEIALSEVGAHEAAAIASNPSQGSLVVWRTGLRINGSLLSVGGTPAPVAFPQLFSAQPRPTVAWNVDTYLVAAPFVGPFGSQAQWHLVSATGVVRTPSTNWPNVATQNGFGYASLEAEAYADGFLLFSAGVAGTTLPTTHTTTVSATKIDRNGNLVNGPSLIATAVAEFSPFLGATGSSVIYSRPIGHAVTQSARVFVREVTESARGAKRRAVR